MGQDLKVNWFSRNLHLWPFQKTFCVQRIIIEYSTFFQVLFEGSYLRIGGNQLTSLRVLKVLVELS
jgi:hypothetical protein